MILSSFDRVDNVSTNSSVMQVGDEEGVDYEVTVLYTEQNGLF